MKKEKTLNDFSVKNPEKCTTEELKFVFSQAENLLLDTEKTFVSNMNKSIKIISVLIAIYVGLLSYLFLHIDISGEFSSLLFTVSILAILSFILICYASLNLKGSKWKCVGSKPSALLNSKFYLKKSKCKDYYSVINGMIFSELINYEKRIDFNLDQNRIISQRINRLFIGLILLPIIGLISYLFVEILM